MSAVRRLYFCKGLICATISYGHWMLAGGESGNSRDIQRTRRSILHKQVASFRLGLVIVQVMERSLGVSFIHSDRHLSGEG